LLESDIEVILFDLGGVLVELSGMATFAQWTGFSDAEIWTSWLCSPAVRAFESGSITAQEFAKQIVLEMKLPVTPADFLTGFESWPKGLYSGAAEMIRQLHPDRRMATMSNTNDLHWPRFINEMQISTYFQHHLPSHQTGRLKPDPEAFIFASEQLRTPPSRILFLDDNQANVDSGCGIGMQGFKVRGITETRKLLSELEIL
jgi:glucose-1-phosphatase